ncbi:DsbA family protein [Streptomyces wuyuanensis]|uniref:DsbA family protein n=1 Tax=Streptomyces wuyuanensis TaxID=1196353 RepID=UPI00380F8779
MTTILVPLTIRGLWRTAKYWRNGSAPGWAPIRRSTPSLLELAGQVDGLRSETFDSAVTTMKYRDFVTASERTYEAAGGDDPRRPGTPTVAVNGTQITGDRYGWLFEKTLFGLLLNSTHNQPQTE